MLFLDFWVTCILPKFLNLQYCREWIFQPQIMFFCKKNPFFLDNVLLNGYFLYGLVAFVNLKKQKGFSLCQEKISL